MASAQSLISEPRPSQDDPPRGVLATSNRVPSVLVMVILVAAGCDSRSRRGGDGVFAYYRHDYPTARDQLRARAEDRRDSNVVLTNLRLGLASLADGDLDESERALMRGYEYLRSGGVNAPDRTAAATFIYEGVRVWKGEPFEQAMGFYYVAALHLLKNDWENARAAAANSLFALHDFKDAETRQDDKFEQIESQFALGYLIAATAETLMGRPEDAAPMYERVRKLNAELTGLANMLQSGQYNTLLLVDLGRGPRKESYGHDQTLVRFTPDGRSIPAPVLSLAVDGQTIDHPGSRPVVDLWTLSQFPRWWSMETTRKVKSAVGNVMLIGGLGAAGVGAATDSPEVALAGVGAAVLGLALKAGSQADTRHLELLPRCVYLVPLLLEPGDHQVRLNFSGDAQSSSTWHDLAAGKEGSPAIYYLRAHAAGGMGMPRWSDSRLYSVRAEHYPAGERPWILGGRDLTPPGDDIAAKYRQSGVLPEATADSLADMYRREGLFFVPGPQGMTGKEALNPQLYRHVTEGGRILFAPRPGSHAYERITRTEHPPYRRRDDL
jgi:hypothetical protein